MGSVHTAKTKADHWEIQAGNLELSCVWLMSWAVKRQSYDLRLVFDSLAPAGRVPCTFGSSQ